MGRHFTPTAVAADILEAFLLGGEDSIQWDDLESAPQENPSVRLAIDIVHYIQKLDPPRTPTEYFNARGQERALKVVTMLRAGRFDHCPIVDDPEDLVRQLPHDIVEDLLLSRAADDSR